MRGVYKITNKTTGKIYIGESLNILQRWLEHKHDLNNNCHHSYKLQQDWNTYGEHNFSFEVIAVLDETIPTYIDKYINIVFEYFYINKYNCINEGYNIENTLLCVINKTKLITSNADRDYRLCKTYYNVFKSKELVNDGGIIYVNSFCFEDINKELNISNSLGKLYFEKLPFHSDATGKIFKDDYIYIDEIIKNSTYSNSKFTHVAYVHILKKLKNIVSSLDDVNESRNKIISSDLKSINIGDLNEGDYDVNNSIKNLTSRYNLKIAYNNLFKLLRSEGILEYRKFNDRKYNYPTDEYRDIFIVVGVHDNSGIRLILTKESEELIIKIMNENHII